MKGTGNEQINLPSIAAAPTKAYMPGPDQLPFGNAQ